MEEYTNALPSTHREQFLAEDRASSLHVSHRLCVSMLYYCFCRSMLGERC